MRNAPLPPVLAAALLLLAACSGDDQLPVDDFVEGRWAGTTQEIVGAPVYRFDLAFEQDERDVTATGEISNGADTVDVEVDGRYDQPDLVFQASAEGYAPVIFTGRIFRGSGAETDSIAGTLSGSGLDGRRLKLMRVVQ